jgi:dTDP-glucose 4,6-dehydratase
MRTYLVTGGAGFIGSNYIHYMFKKYDNDIRIINVDALTYAGNLENLKDVENRDNYTFIKADITDKKAISKIFEENDIDRVVHFAAESHVDRSIRNPEVFVQTNVLGTAVMLNCAKAAWELEDGSFKDGKKFLHVSTDEVYGSLENEGEYFYETTPYAPHSPYSASKASSDMLVKAYMDTSSQLISLTALTTMDHTNSQRSLYRLSSTMLCMARSSRYMEMARMCVTGYMLRIMLRLSTWCRKREGYLRHTMSAVIMRSRILRLSIL